MLHHHLFSPFSDPARQAQYERVRDALQADSTGPVSVLLGNFAVEEGAEPLDAIVVRPHSITLLLFIPRGGKLVISSLGLESWQLDNQMLSGATAGADNPFKQFQQQKEALATWLTPQFDSAQVNLQFISGIVVFAGPLTFGPGVEEQLSSQPGGNFQLLADAGQLPRRLKQLARPEIDLTDEELTQWAQELTQEPEAQPEPRGFVSAESDPAPAAAKGLWGRAWRWLGADDIPEDTPYGSPAAQVAASSAEKQRLERLQLEAQAEVRQQLQALEAREAERERSMAELRAQLAHAAPVTTEAQVLRERLAAENQEKTSLEEAIRTSRAELEARNQDLDAKINQLGQLIEQLNARAAAPPPGPDSAPEPSAAVASKPRAVVAPEPQAVPEPRVRATPELSDARQPLPAPVGFPGLHNLRHRRPRVAALIGVLGLLLLIGWVLSRVSSASLVPFQENGKWGFAKENGETVIPARYSSVAPFQQEQAVVEENGVYGMIDEAGKEVVPLAYDALNPYAEGYARVRVSDAYTFLDEQGQEFDSYYFNALDFSDGCAAVLDHRGWYYITGPEAEDPARPPVIFREAYAFREGLARVKLADGYTFITKKYLTDPSIGTDPFGRYETATDFENGKAQVTHNGRRFTINTDGETVD